MHIFTSKKRDIILKLFEMTKRPDNWEVYLPLEGGNVFVLFRPICSKCGKYWSVDRKECFDCKTKYYHVKICPKCNKIYPENVIRCEDCEERGRKIRTLKMCLNCTKKPDSREKVFIPTTFCWHCGNRQNEFEFKILEIK